MLRSILAKTLWDQRRGIVIWSLAIGAVPSTLVVGAIVFALFLPLIKMISEMSDQ